MNFYTQNLFENFWTSFIHCVIHPFNIHFGYYFLHLALLQTWRIRQISESKFFWTLHPMAKQQRTQKWHIKGDQPCEHIKGDRPCEHIKGDQPCEGLGYLAERDGYRGEVGSAKAFWYHCFKTHIRKWEIELHDYLVKNENKLFSSKRKQVPRLSGENILVYSVKSKKTKMTRRKETEWRDA